MSFWDEVKAAADTAEAIATDPAAREAVIAQAEDKAAEYASNPAQAVADAKEAASEVRAAIADAKREARAYAQEVINDPARAVEDAREAVAEAKKLYQEAYAQYGPEAVAQKALQMARAELLAVEAKAAQLKALAEQGIAGAQAMAEALAGEIEGLTSVAVAACAAMSGPQSSSSSTSI